MFTNTQLEAGFRGRSRGDIRVHWENEVRKNCRRNEEESEKEMRERKEKDKRGWGRWGRWV